MQQAGAAGKVGPAVPHKRVAACAVRLPAREQIVETQLQGKGVQTRHSEPVLRTRLPTLQQQQQTGAAAANQSGGNSSAGNIICPGRFSRAALQAVQRAALQFRFAPQATSSHVPSS